MPTTAGTVLDIILERIRGDGGVAHTDAVGLDILSKSQRIANVHLQSVISETNFNTVASQSTYALSTILPSAIDILELRLSTGVKLSRAPSFDYLPSTFGTAWYTATAAAPQAFYQLGRTHLFIYPATTGIVALTARYSKLTTILDERTDNFDLVDADIALASQLAEISLLLRQRATGEASHLVKDLIQRYLPELIRSSGGPSS